MSEAREVFDLEFVVALAKAVRGKSYEEALCSSARALEFSRRIHRAVLAQHAPEVTAAEAAVAMRAVADLLDTC